MPQAILVNPLDRVLQSVTGADYDAIRALFSADAQLEGNTLCRSGTYGIYLQCWVDCQQYLLAGWLHRDQAVVYSRLPPYILRGLIAHRLLLTRAGGTLIKRDSIDRVLLEATLAEPVFWKRNPEAK